MLTVDAVPPLELRHDQAEMVGNCMVFASVALAPGRRLIEVAGDTVAPNTLQVAGTLLIRVDPGRPPAFDSRVAAFDFAGRPDQIPLDESTAFSTTEPGEVFLEPHGAGRSFWVTDMSASDTRSLCSRSPTAWDPTDSRGASR